MSESRKPTRANAHQTPSDPPPRVAAPKRTHPPRVTDLGLDDLPVAHRGRIHPSPDLPPPPRISSQAQAEQDRASQPEPRDPAPLPARPSAPRGQADLPPPPAISSQRQNSTPRRTTQSNATPASRGQADLPPPPAISSQRQTDTPQHTTQSNTVQPRGQADLPPPPAISSQRQSSPSRRTTQSNAAPAPRGQADLPPPPSISSQVQARRNTTTITRAKTTAPALVLKREREEPEALLSPLHAPTIELHQQLYDRPGSARAAAIARSLPQPGQPMMLLIAAISVVVLAVLSMTPSRTIISGYNPFGSQPASTPAASQLQTPDGQHSVLGASTISPQQIDTVLKEYGSPAAGTGAIWIEMAQKYNINAAYALAFFIHESSAGTNPGWAGLKPDGSTTHNIGNIICAGYATCYGRFRDYPGWREGIEDWYRLIAREYVEDRGAHTVEQIIPIYAPSFENNVPAYVKAVTDLVIGWQQGSAR